MSGRRAALAVAFKTARRKKKRTFYLVLLIAIPVMVAVMTSVFMNASYVSPEESTTSQFGKTNVMLDWSATAAVDAWVETTLEEIAPEAERLSYRSAHQTFAAQTWGAVTDMDLEDPLTGGLLTMVAGRGPAGFDEVVLTEHLANVLDAGIGDRVELDTASGESEFEVVGLATHPVYWADNQAAVTTGAMDRFIREGDESGHVLLKVDDDLEFSQAIATAWEEEKYDFYPGDREWPIPERLSFIWEGYYAAMTDEELAEAERLLDVEGVDASARYVADLFINGVSEETPYVNATSKSEMLTWNQGSIVETGPVIGTGVAALILVEVGFIAGAAFATGTRRRLREIGLLGANGASQKHVRATVVGEGLVVGVVAGLLGSLLAFAIVLFGRSVIQHFVVRRIDEFPFGPLDVTGPILVAVIACVAAAWIPARTASAVPTLTALQGRMPVAAPKRWVIPAGLVVAAFGTLLLAVGLAGGDGGAAAVAVIGAVLMIGGTALLAGPLVASISKRAERFPVTWRIVLRDSGRQRGRAAAAVAATMVILMAPIGGLVAMATNLASQGIYGLGGGEPQLLLEGRYDPEADYELVSLTDDDLELVGSLLPEARIASFQALDTPVEYPAELAAREQGDPESEGGYYTGSPRAAIANEGLLALVDNESLNRALQSEGMVLVGVEDRDTKVTVDGVAMGVPEIPAVVPPYSFPRLLVTEDVASQIGSAPRHVALVELDAGLFQNPFSSPFQPLWQEDADWSTGGGGSDGATPTVLLLGFLATMVVVLVVVATITALSAAEADNDLRTVVAVGATNSIRRRYLGLQSGLHTLIGAVLAIPLTLLLYKTVMMASGTYRTIGHFGVWDSSNIRIPWSGFGLLIVGLPLAIGLITAVSVRSAPTTPPRRAT